MIKKNISSIINQWHIKRRTQGIRRYTEETLASLEGGRLTSSEKEHLHKTWGEIGVKFTDRFHALVKAVTKQPFDPRYVSEELFYPYILRSLNPAKYTGAYEYKGSYHRLFPEFKQPVCILNVIGDVVHDRNDNRVDGLEAVYEILEGKTFIVKPSTDSNCGKKIKSVSNATKDSINSIFSEYRRDFIIQEFCSQSEQTKCFNPSSLNTFRVTTLYLNGRLSILNILFRCGRGDTIVDNGGAGGLMCGCSIDGQLKPYAYDTSYNKYTESSTGQPFGISIPDVKKIVALLEQNVEKVLPFCGIVGWDFALDQENEPVMIEINNGGAILTFPGIAAEQICNESPIFGNRTQEVIDYVKNNRPLFRDLMMS